MYTRGQDGLLKIRGKPWWCVVWCVRTCVTMTRDFGLEDKTSNHVRYIAPYKHQKKSTTVNKQGKNRKRKKKTRQK